MNEKQTEELLQGFLVGQAEALAALTRAVAAVVGAPALAEQLRLQLIAYPPLTEEVAATREALLMAAWQAIRPPACSTSGAPSRPTSSGQIACQSSGRRSQRITS